MVWLVVQISVWVMVSCCLPKQHLIFPWFTVNKSWFSKDCSMHLHPLSSSTNINFILCLHRKENASFPCGVIRKKAKISTWYKLNMDIIACYIYIYFSHQGNFISAQIGFVAVQACLTASHPICFQPPRMGIFHWAPEECLLLLWILLTETGLTHFVLMENSSLSQEYPAISLCQELTSTSMGASHALCR